MWIDYLHTQKMKKKARYNWMAPSTRQIFATSLVFLQIVNLISTQANIEPLDNSQLRGGLREIRALKLSQGEAECSQCNKMSEVSFVNQQFFLIIFLWLKLACGWRLPCHVRLCLRPMLECCSRFIEVFSKLNTSNDKHSHNFYEPVFHPALSSFSATLPWTRKICFLNVREGENIAKRALPVAINRVCSRTFSRCRWVE